MESLLRMTVFRGVIAKDVSVPCSLRNFPSNIKAFTSVK